MKRLTLLVILLLTLSSCGNSSDRFNFSGSSENWEVFYVVNVFGKDNEEKNGTIKFIGEEDPPETIDYKIETISGGSEGTGVTLNDGVGNIGNAFCEGCAVIQRDEEIEVEIVWNGQTENLVLTTEK